MADKKTVTCVLCNKSKAPYQFIKHGNEKMSDKFDGLTAVIDHTPMLEISLLYKGEPRIVYA